VSAAPITAVDDYVEFCAGVRGLCEVDLSQYKRTQMERRIRSFAVRRGAPRLADYLRRLATDVEELDRLLDRVTINVSQLWRNPAQWTLLQHDVLPALAQTERIRAWSAGSSYGAEAYTLAAVARASAPTSTDGWSPSRRSASSATTTPAMRRQTRSSGGLCARPPVGAPARSSGR